MPTKSPKDTSRPSGRGIGVTGTAPFDRQKWYPPRPFGLSGSGGSPSASADTTFSRWSQATASDEDTYFIRSDGMQVCNHGKLVDDCPVCGKHPENESVLLRALIREHISLQEREGSGFDLTQVALDLAGLIPGVGEAFDLTSAVRYMSRGDYLFAALSVVSMIPEVGDIIGKGGKLTAWVVREFPKVAAAVAKHGPEVVKAVRTTKQILVKNNKMIDSMFDVLERDERFKGKIPAMRQALRAFVGGRQSLGKEVDEMSTVGGGSIAGYTLPLGMGGTGTTGVPDNRKRRKAKSKR